MVDILFGVVAMLAGALLCFRGQLVLRLVFPIWGAFAGFGFGAGLVSAFSDEHFLGTVLGWVLGIVFALIFGLFAYLYYAVGVVIAMASIGFALGSGLVVAVGIDWNWVAVTVGVLLGALVGVAAILTDVPMLLLILLSAAAGAVVMVTGAMLVTGAVDSSTFSDSSFTSRIDDSWWWYAVFLVLTGAGVLLQVRDAAALRRSMRSSWAEASR
jgi:hypothetical protein